MKIFLVFLAVLLLLAQPRSAESITDSDLAKMRARAKDMLGGQPTDGVLVEHKVFQVRTTPHNKCVSVKTVVDPLSGFTHERWKCPNIPDTPPADIKKK